MMRMALQCPALRLHTPLPRWMTVCPITGRVTFLISIIRRRHRTGRRPTLHVHHHRHHREQFPEVSLLMIVLRLRDWVIMTDAARMSFEDRLRFFTHA